MLILALDLGTAKSKTAVTILDSQTGETRRTKVETTASALLTLLRAERPDRVVMESTIPTGWVVDLCRAEDIREVQVANPLDEAWRNRTTKTDPRDADLLAKLSVSGQLRLIHVPERPVREWRILIDYRQRLVRSRTRIKNRIRTLLKQEGLPSGKLWSQEGRGKLAGLARPLSSCPAPELWRGILATELERLDEVAEHLAQVEERLDALARQSAGVEAIIDLPGIGPRTAEAVVATLDDPRRFKNQKDVGAYYGLVPRVHQSGQRRHLGRITKAGDPLVRALLIEIVHLAVRRQQDHWIKSIYLRLLRGEQGRSQRAIVATARRVGVILWAKLRDHRRLHPDLPTLAATLATAA